MKQLIYVMLLFGCLSCGTGNYVKTKYVKVQGTPDVDFYLKNQYSSSSSDGFEKFGASSDIAKPCKKCYVLVGSTDDAGNGILKLSTKEYKKSKKRVIAVKSGYVPYEFKLKKRFNASVLFNLIWPPAFFFDHSTVLSVKAINRLEITKKSTQTCFDYLEMAENSFNQKEKIEYFKKAIGQDYRNENGVKVVAMNQLGNIYGKMGDIHLAYLVLKQAYQEDQSTEIEESMEQLRGIIEEKNLMAAHKRERQERTLNTLNMIGSSLAAAGNALASPSGTVGAISSVVGTSVEATTNRSKGSQKSSTYGSLNETTAKNSDSNTYSKWEDQLVKMNTYYEREYSDSQRRYIQQQMKSIREKWQKKGYKMYQSEWEAWSGNKR